MQTTADAAQPALLRAVIPYGEIANPDTFEAGRLEGMALAIQGQDPDFGRLVNETTLKDGQDLAVPILDQVCAPDNPENAKRFLAAAHEAGKHVLEVVMAPDEENGLRVVAMYKRGSVAEDKKATRLSRLVARSVGYGRRQNDSSGVFSGAMYPSGVTKNTRSRR